MVTEILIWVALSPLLSFPSFCWLSPHPGTEYYSLWDWRNPWSEGSGGSGDPAQHLYWCSTVEVAQGRAMQQDCTLYPCMLGACVVWYIHRVQQGFAWHVTGCVVWWGFHMVQLMARTTCSVQHAAYGCAASSLCGWGSLQLPSS